MVDREVAERMRCGGRGGEEHENDRNEGDASDRF
jgi:hypothetical protein